MSYAWRRDNNFLWICCRPLIVLYSSLYKCTTQHIDVSGTCAINSCCFLRVRYPRLTVTRLQNVIGASRLWCQCRLLQPSNTWVPDVSKQKNDIDGFSRKISSIVITRYCDASSRDNGCSSERRFINYLATQLLNAIYACALGGPRYVWFFSEYWSIAQNKSCNSLYCKRSQKVSYCTLSISSLNNWPFFTIFHL